MFHQLTRLVKISQNCTAIIGLVIFITACHSDDQPRKQKSGQAPVAANSEISVPMNQQTAGQLQAVDSDSQQLSYTIVSSPTKGSITITDPAVGSFVYIHSGTETGQDQFTFSVSDGANISNVATVNIIIVDATTANLSPVINQAIGCILASRELAVTDTIDASDPDDDLLTYRIADGKNGTKGTAVISDSTTGALVYTPDGINWGLDTFTVEIEDTNNAVITEEVTVNIAARVMPLGDSITEGVTKNAIYDDNDELVTLDEPEPIQSERIGYRMKLKQDLVARGYSVDFVGSRDLAVLDNDATQFPQAQLHGGYGYELFTDFESEGHGGFTSAAINNNLSGWLESAPADIVLLHIGTNDFMGTDEAPLPPPTDNVNAILSKIQDANSKMVVFIARIIGWNPSNPKGITNDHITQFNNNVESLVTNNYDANRHFMVDQFSALTYPEDINDVFNHPTQTAYDKMASTWLAAIETNQVLEKCPE